MTDALDDIADAARGIARAEQQLAERVEAARDQGHTWQEVADVLGVTRQAAFKRFGHPTDPVTGQPLHPAPVADVARLARTAVERFADGDLDALRDTMTQACSRQLTRRLLRQVRADVADTFGELVDLEPPSQHTADGSPLPAGAVALPAVGRVVLQLAAGRCIAHVVVNRDSRITGMTVRPASVEETWPL